MSLVTVIIFAFAACGGGGHDDHDAGSSGGEKGDPMGAPADPADADRVIEVFAKEPNRFDPESIGVKQGETVLFRVTNDGRGLHEFVLGEHVHGEEDDGSVQLAPGETKELAWTFESTGNVEFACFVPGHYESGMHGTISVAS
jgi:uncharacterized cupredoxin-like copper-binding protein